MATLVREMAPNRAVILATPYRCRYCGHGTREHGAGSAAHLDPKDVDRPAPVNGSRSCIGLRRKRSKRRCLLCGLTCRVQRYFGDAPAAEAALLNGVLRCQRCRQVDQPRQDLVRALNRRWESQPASLTNPQTSYAVVSRWAPASGCCKTSCACSSPPAIPSVRAPWSSCACMCVTCAVRHGGLRYMQADAIRER